jgi:hypothetical protein
MRIQVTNCKDCVFNVTGRDETPYCKLDVDNRDIPTDKTGYYATDEIPEWCPIYNEVVLIELKK